MCFFLQEGEGGLAYRLGARSLLVFRMPSVSLYDSQTTYETAFTISCQRHERVVYVDKVADLEREVNIYLR